MCGGDVRVVFFDSLSLCNCNINAVYLCVFVRYAFSPLLDEESEEEEKEPMMNEAFGQKPSLPPSPLSTCCLPFLSHLSVVLAASYLFNSSFNFSVS